MCAFRCCVFVVSLIVLGPARADEPKAANLPPELSWIPVDAAGFLHVRLGELVKSPAWPAVSDSLNRNDPGSLDRLERAIGVQLHQVDRLTVVIPGPSGSAPEESVVVRVTTTTAYDADAVRKRLGVGKSPLPNRARLPASGGEVLFTDDKNLTFAYARGTRSGALFTRVARRPETGRLVAALKLAAEPHFLVAALDVAQVRLLPWVADDSSLRPFFIARSAVLVGDLKPEGISLTMRFTAGLRGHAEEVADALDVRRAEHLKSLADRLKAINTKTDPGAAKNTTMLADAFKAARIERKDREVIATAALPSVEPLAVAAIDAVDGVQCAADRLASANNLKQFGLGMHNYHDTNGHLPAAILSKDNKPLLSWRVALLPFIEQDALFKQFKLDQAWDSEHNKKLIDKMPKIFVMPGDRKKTPPSSTYYRIFVGNGAMFDLKQKTNFASITDGLSNTVMVVEAEDAVIWTKPDEIEYDPKKPPKLGYHYAGRSNVVAGDGATHTIRRNIDERMLHHLIQRSDGHPVVFDD